MLDFDLAQLYEVPTKALNQAVKRNLRNFPPEFMFRLTIAEWQALRSQYVTAMPAKRNASMAPYAFTEYGIAMLSSVLKSDRAVMINISIIKAFIDLRCFSLTYKDLAGQINQIRQTVDSHSEQLSLIYGAIENILDEKAEQKNWEDRERIGFKN